LKILPYINGQLVNDPNNLSELSIELNFDSDNPTSTVSINEWEIGIGSRFGVDGSKLANQHIIDGLTGNVGVFEGVPFAIDIEKGGATDRVFDGFLDLSEAKIECDLITAPAIETGKIDWLNEVADSFTFEYLATSKKNGGPGLIDSNDYILVPYIISRLPQTTDAILLTVSLFVVVSELTDQLQTFNKEVLGAANPFGWDNILKAAVSVLYIGVLIITVIKLLSDLFNLIIQPVKYHAGMSYLDLSKKGAAHLGLTFESPILESNQFKNLVWLPEKFQQPQNNDGILGFLSTSKTVHKGFFKGTYGDWLRHLKTMFKAKVLINGGVIKLIPEDFNDSVSTYQIPPLERNGYNLNASEFKSNYLLEFQVDFNDKNTVREYSGTSIQIQTVPKIVVNRSMVLNKGLETITFQCALGKRKTELTVPEKVFVGIFTVVDPLIQGIVFVVNIGVRTINLLIRAVNLLFRVLRTISFGAIRIRPIPRVPLIRYKSIKNLIEDRVGMLKMETDFISVPKTVMVANTSNARNNKLLAGNESILNASYFWENYHSTSSFDSETYPKHNQHKLWSIDNVPFCFDDYQLVKSNNKIIDSDGVTTGEVVSLQWNIFDQAASIRFKTKEVYTKNLRTIKLTPDGR